MYRITKKRTFPIHPLLQSNFLVFPGFQHLRNDRYVIAVDQTSGRTGMFQNGRPFLFEVPLTKTK